MSTIIIRSIEMDLQKVCLVQHIGQDPGAQRASYQNKRKKGRGLPTYNVSRKA